MGTAFYDGIYSPQDQKPKGEEQVPNVHFIFRRRVGVSSPNPVHSQPKLLLSPNHHHINRQSSDHSFLVFSFLVHRIHSITIADISIRIRLDSFGY